MSISSSVRGHVAVFTLINEYKIRHVCIALNCVMKQMNPVIRNYLFDSFKTSFSHLALIFCATPSDRVLWILVCLSHRSLDFDDGPNESETTTVPLLEEAMAKLAPDPTDCVSDQPQAAAEGPGEEIPLQEINSGTDSELQEFHEHHRRLLPNCKNAIHVIDGPERRYFVGIIDIFTVYGWKKRLENLWKSLRYPGRAFSTVSPPKYARRFCQWIQDHSQ